MPTSEHKRMAAARLRAAGLTLADIGAQLGVTGERARQLLLPVAPRSCRACGGAIGPRKQYHSWCRPSGRRSPASGPGLVVDLTSLRFGRWTVLRHAGAGSQWVCRCECGAEDVVRSALLRNGLSLWCRQCGPRQVEQVTGPAGAVSLASGGADLPASPNLA